MAQSFPRPGRGVDYLAGHGASRHVQVASGGARGQVGVACDAADVFSAVTAYKRGGVTAPSVATLAGTAAVATALGVAALQE